MRRPNSSYSGRRTGRIMIEQDQVHASEHCLAIGGSLPGLDQLMAIAIPASPGCCGTLDQERLEWIPPCRRQAVDDDGQRWCGESITAGSNAVGAWAADWDRCPLRRHWEAERGGPPGRRAAPFFAVSGVSPQVGGE